MDVTFISDSTGGIPSWFTSAAPKAALRGDAVPASRTVFISPGLNSVVSDMRALAVAPKLSQLSSSGGEHSEVIAALAHDVIEHDCSEVVLLRSSAPSKALHGVSSILDDLMNIECKSLAKDNDANDTNALSTSSADAARELLDPLATLPSVQPAVTFKEGLQTRSSGQTSDPLLVFYGGGGTSASAAGYASTAVSIAGPAVNRLHIGTAPAPAGVSSACCDTAAAAAAAASATPAPVAESHTDAKTRSSHPDNTSESRQPAAAAPVCASSSARSSTGRLLNGASGMDSHTLRLLSDVVRAEACATAAMAQASASAALGHVAAALDRMACASSTVTAPGTAECAVGADVKEIDVAPSVAKHAVSAVASNYSVADTGFALHPAPSSAMLSALLRARDVALLAFNSATEGLHLE